MENKIITKEIKAWGEKVVIACDGLCSKAWGINHRPNVKISKDPDDIAYLADNELGIAPADPGVYEGGDAKPTTDEERLNKWCYRECERCGKFEPDEVIVLHDFSTRIYNIPR